MWTHPNDRHRVHSSEHGTIGHPDVVRDRLDAHILKTVPGQDRRERPAVAETVADIGEYPESLSRDMIEVFDERNVDREPCANGHASTRTEHAPHLTNGRRLVRNELQTPDDAPRSDRKSTRLNSSHSSIS